MKTMLDRFADLEGLWGERNKTFLTVPDSTALLNDGVRRFSKIVREGKENAKDQTEVNSALCSLFARAWCVANVSSTDIHGLMLALRQKQPRDRCTYCSSRGCICGENRTSDIVLAPPDPTQLNLTVDQWCVLIHEKYGRRNRDRGLSGTIGHLWEEVGEMSTTLYILPKVPSITSPVVQAQKNLELADVFSWIFAITAMLGKELDPLLEVRHTGPHHRCGQRPCICGPYYNYLQVDPHGQINANTRSITY